ncbi:MAG TPA: DUF2326 domain-containing protein [Acidiferrobacteraceae bacterium]|nr:DUF2326 domain-containing protein [Acidiferrobacteraceae bacterium]
MKLSRLYTNDTLVFTPIDFREGFNVVLARIRHPKDDEKSSHCLGKTLLVDVIDFCLLKSVGTKNHFLKSRDDLFGDLVFFLELELSEGGYVTVRRPVHEATRISFKRHEERHQDYINSADETWDHLNISLAAGVRMLDGYLALSMIKPWNYRKGVSYFMRRQEDYSNEFQLRKFSSGSHKDWKPYVARVLGFHDAPITQKYEADAAHAKIKERRTELQGEVMVKLSDYEKLRASITVKRDEVEQKVSALDEFDFKAQELGLSEELADEIEKKVADINEALYNARFDLNQTKQGLEDEVHFDLKDVQRVFSESKITFPDQLARDYTDLVDFNRRILSERRTSLKNRAEELEREIKSLENTNIELAEKRKSILQVLGGTDSLKKYKSLQKELDHDRASVALMEEKAEKLDAIRELNDELRKTKAKCDELTVTLEELVTNGSDRYRQIQKTFSRIIKEVLHRTAVLYVQQNDSGNLDFHAEFTDADSDAHTQERRGTSFRKILCIAFDLAVLTSYAKKPFFHFVYHDGALEQLESKRKLALLSVVRQACADYGIQYILSALDEELPEDEDTAHLCPRPEEVIVELHDGGDNGRLFKLERF